MVWWFVFMCGFVDGLCLCLCVCVCVALCVEPELRLREKERLLESPRKCDSITRLKKK